MFNSIADFFTWQMTISKKLWFNDVFLFHEHFWMHQLYLVLGILSVPCLRVFIWLAWLRGYYSPKTRIIYLTMYQFINLSFDLNLCMFILWIIIYYLLPWNVNLGFMYKVV